MVPQHGPFSLHTMLEALWLPKMAFPTLIIRPLDESQGSSPLQGHGSSLMCIVALTATSSHAGQDMWPWDCESPKVSVPRLSQDTSKIMSCGHGPSSVVCSPRMQQCPLPHVISMNFYLCGVVTCDRIHYINGCEHWECHGLPVLCVRPTSKSWFLKSIQVTMKHDPFDAM